MEFNSYKITNAVRKSIVRFFESQDYEYLDTPILVGCPGAEANLNYFSTEYKNLEGERSRFYLPSSPEVSMKKMMGSFEISKAYQIAHSFRNKGEKGPLHRPEFRMVEWYELDKSMSDLISQTKNLIINVSSEVKQSSALKFEEFSCAELVLAKTGVNLRSSFEDWKKQARSISHSIVETDGENDAFFKIWIEKIDPFLATLEWAVIYDWPSFIPTLAKSETGGISKRFEFYYKGVEVCNGYSELLGSTSNRNRFSEINKERELSGLEALNPDEDFFRSLDKLRVNEMVGNAMGLERLVCAVFGLNSIVSEWDN